AELIAELSNSRNSGIKPVAAERGRYEGTFVCKELVYAYAMWVSASFHLKVIRAYDSLVTAPAAPADSAG
ncbi:MAG: KilA-N domain-containing protein, partial [Gammaproteobacteria bacterium]|nr:KilA-N domain-containing protein [Gammaproteobacteria bacterium]